MTLPLSRIIPPDFEGVRTDLSDIYSSLAHGINGDIAEFTPTISGSGTAGSGTYTTQSGIYYRQGLLTDVWFFLDWSNHSGTGNIMIDLPFEAKLTASDVFVDILEISGINLSANYYYAVARVGTDSFQAAVMEVGDNVAPQAIAMDTSAKLRGHIRYIGIAD